MDSLKCITANPDITGIGVRIAIYAQNLLCFVPIGLHLWDGIISDEELKGIKDQSIGMLAIAFAILISIIIQAKTAVQGQPITGFHAAVILDLSWMNNTSTWIWFLLYAHHISNADAEEEAAEKKWDPRCPRCRLEWGRQSIPATISAWFSVIRSTACPRHGKQQGFFAPVLLPIENLFWRALVLFIGSVHLSLMAGIGIWLWSHPTQFGTPMDCVPTLTIVGRSVPFTSKPLQIFSLAMYSIIAVPLVNLLPPIAFFLALHIAYNQARRPISRWICFWTGGGLGHVNDHKIHKIFLVLGLLLLAVINIILLIDIERTILHNKPLETGEDSSWGFGQVLALLLLAIPLRDIWNALRDIREGRHNIQKQFEQVIFEELTATPLRERLRVLIIRRADPEKPIKGTGFKNALQGAAYLGNKDAVEFFLSKMIEDKHLDGPDGCATALQAASASGQKDIVEQLLNRDSSSTYIDFRGGVYETAFCAACANGRLEVAQLLRERGADVRLYGEKFGPPLHLATLAGHANIIEWLLRLSSDIGVDVSMKWRLYGTAQDVAVVMDEQKPQALLRDRGVQLFLFRRERLEPWLEEGRVERARELRQKRDELRGLQYFKSESELK